MGISLGIMGISLREYHGISWGYYGYKVVLEQSDVIPLKVELKLGHWPSTALSFISSLTIKNPGFTIYNTNF
jgi:hypothetical protein